LGCRVSEEWQLLLRNSCDSLVLVGGEERTNMRENVFLLKEIIRSLSMEGTDYGLLVHEDGAFGVSSIAVERRCSKHVLVMEARTRAKRWSFLGHVVKVIIMSIAS
jgi:hypothetical protein